MAWLEEQARERGEQTADDRPIASFLWPGNTADMMTLLPVVERLRARFGIGRTCVVSDRGMISAATIAGLEAQGIGYILGVRERSTAEVRSTVIDDDGVAVPLSIPRQKGETDLAIKDIVLAGRRYVLCRNAEQARKDAETRTALLASLERKLAQGDKALVEQPIETRIGLDFRGIDEAVACGIGQEAAVSGVAQDAAGHAADLSPYRCCHPWPYFLYFPRPGIA
jgi:hypothetical protein